MIYVIAENPDDIIGGGKGGVRFKDDAANIVFFSCPPDLLDRLRLLELGPESPDEGDHEIASICWSP